MNVNCRNKCLLFSIYRRIVINLLIVSEGKAHFNFKLCMIKLLKRTQYTRHVNIATNNI